MALCNVLVVDDDRVTRELVRGILVRDGFPVDVAASGKEALALATEKEFPIIVSDVQMSDMTGIDLLTELTRILPHSVRRRAVILMTGYGSLTDVVHAMKEGAFDYLTKPLKLDELRQVIARALEHVKASEEMPPSMAESSADIPELHPRSLIGRSPRMIEVYKVLAKATLTSSNVLIVGESGTGKELVARAVHENSARSNRAFVTVNCGALAETLLESELFGHVRGSFTGAVANKRGLFEEADGGSIFLDEIGDISPSLQVKLLRVLQEGEFKPVGSNETKRVDARVIAATHRDLLAFVREGRFREDLYYRLKVISIDIPPLRERSEDLPDLVRHFTQLYSRRMGKIVHSTSPEAMQLLLSYPWPGNIRELENTIERAVALTSTSVLHPTDLAPEILNYDRNTYSQAEPPPPAMIAENVAESPRSLEQMEKCHIIRILGEVNFNKSKAADILGIDRATLYRKAQRYGITLVPEGKRGSSETAKHG